MPNVITSPIGGPGSQFFNSQGQVLGGGLLYTYLAGSTTPAPTYTDFTGGTPQPNPVTLDSAGRPPNNGVWIDNSVSYKFVLTSNTDTPQGTWDNINTPGTLAQFLDATRITSTQNLPASVGTTIQFNSITTNVGNSWNAGGFTFVARSSGVFVASVSLDVTPVALPTLGDSLLLSFAKNGVARIVDRIVVDRASFSERILNATMSFQMVANDQLRVDITNLSAVAWTLNITNPPYLTVTSK